MPRNRFAGIRTPATLRSDAAFSAANRVAAPTVVAAGAVCAAGGSLAFGAGGSALTVIIAVAGTGAVWLLLASGLLGHRVAAAIAAPTGGCADGWLRRLRLWRWRLSHNMICPVLPVAACVTDQ